MKKISLLIIFLCFGTTSVGAWPCHIIESPNGQFFYLDCEPLEEIDFCPGCPFPEFINYKDLVTRPYKELVGFDQKQLNEQKATQLEQKALNQTLSK